MWKVLFFAKIGKMNVPVKGRIMDIQPKWGFGLVHIYAKFEEYLLNTSEIISKKSL